MELGSKISTLGFCWLLLSSFGEVNLHVVLSREFTVQIILHCKVLYLDKGFGEGNMTWMGRGTISTRKGTWIEWDAYSCSHVPTLLARVK